MEKSTQRSHTTLPQKLGLFAFGCALTLLVLEAGFRLLPVHDSMRALPVNASQPIARFEPNRDFTYSLGWDFNIVNTGHVNNAGFVNDQDYSKNAASPLVAVIGDSFVEALMVPYPQTLQGTLARAVGKEGRVYSFGMSRSPLSQYLAYADFVRREYKPRSMIFVIVGNDFDESHLRYRQATWQGRLHYFKDDGQGGLDWVRLDYDPSGFRQWMRESALLRYLYINLHAPIVIKQLASRMKNWVNPSADPQPSSAGKPEYVGNTAASADADRLRVSRQAVDKFFEMLPEKSGLDSSQILFVVDGMRPQLYDPELYKSAHESYFGRMRSYFMGRAQRLGYEFVDLHPYFAAKHKRTGMKFEFERDGHWSGKGHMTAAEAVLQTTLWTRLFPGAHLGIGE